MTDLKMTNLKLRRDAKILVCDGRTALFLKNTGMPGREKFEVERTMRQDLPSHTADMGADKPGRNQNRAGPSSAMETTDYHTDQETAFITEAVTAFAALHAQSSGAQVVIVAPPRALAVIRAHAHPGLTKACVAEINKDLTKHPVEDIQRIVLG